MTDTPKKTLSITRKPATTGTVNSPTTGATTTGATTNVVRRTGKRIMTRDQLPASRASIGQPVYNRQGAKPKAKKPKPKRKPQPKKQVIPPSSLRMQELDARLNAFPVWVMYKPLSLGIEKEIFRLINDEAFSASKRVVQKLLRMHTQHGLYLQALQRGGARYTLDGTEMGSVIDYQRQLAAETLAKRLQGKG